MTERVSTAVHEAGHAVAGFSVRARPLRAALHAAGTDGPAGEVTAGLPWWEFGGQLLISLAGPAAEVMFGPNPKPDASYADVAVRRGVGPDVERSVGVLRNPRAVGTDLIPFCSRLVADKIIRAAYREARCLLAGREAALRVVAEGLLVMGRLEGDEIRALLPQPLAGAGAAHILQIERMAKEIESNAEVTLPPGQTSRDGGGNAPAVEQLWLEGI